MDAFAKEKGYEFEYQPYPVTQLYAQFVEQKVDFKIPDNTMWAQDMKKGKSVVYSQSVIGYIDGVSVKKENKGKGLPALKVLGTVRGFTAWDYLGQIKDGKVILLENNDVPSLIEMANLGRVDGVYFNIKVLENALTASMKRTLIFDEGLPHTKSTYHLSTIKYPIIVKEFDEFLKNNPALVNQIKIKYGL